MSNFLTGVKIDHPPIPCEDLKCEQERTGDIFINYPVNGERFSPENPADNAFNGFVE
ncbi:hypothetical protein JKJ00_19670 [Klebsiella pneumoniae]|uniref:hypothetical protein n=1 Tax=Klebsiella pneumoniae TaxID=573 RepID=UPI001324C711|nr:hypothetical protein [Klebsiella pneumoniae]MBK6112948.1 hypothetical protein [Klebsiella pneumoniae]MBK6150695.1 hypothetical protein [Klebsiella pneumoniae]MBK6155949.1 hypothetical protein [Klebsiella pneumoniae]MBK6208756.1 hypothetical protein [Klebsiella pneumoniae]MBL0365609.1 hypothetical protein [Klebsiella pneumoniae]